MQLENQTFATLFQGQLVRVHGGIIEIAGHSAGTTLRFQVRAKSVGFDSYADIYRNGEPGSMIGVISTGILALGCCRSDGL